MSILTELFDRFTTALGLKVSKQKYEIISMGMTEFDKQALIHMTGFKHGIRYFEVSLTPIKSIQSDAKVLLIKESLESIPGLGK